MINGFLLINKDSGITSSRVVQNIKKKFNFKKVGHLGTLDPMATGLLILAVNRATKFSSLLLESYKSYGAEVTLGIQTDTDDSEGKIISTKAIICNKEGIESQLLSFLGESNQVPPIYSALKVQGKPMYKYARAGEKVAKASRRICINSIAKIIINPPIVSFEVECSKGTYIRSIARDLGEKLGCGAHLSSLARLTQQNFSLTSAKKIDEISEKDLIAIEDAFIHLDAINIPTEQLKQFMNGVALNLKLTNTDLMRVYNPSGEFIAIGKNTHEGFRHEYLV